jgi:hypothetical protein
MNNEQRLENYAKKNFENRRAAELGLTSKQAKQLWKKFHQNLKKNG